MTNLFGWSGTRRNRRLPSKHGHDKNKRKISHHESNSLPLSLVTGPSKRGQAFLSGYGLFEMSPENIVAEESVGSTPAIGWNVPVSNDTAVFSVWDA